MRRVVIHLHGSTSDTTSLASAIDFCRKLNARLSVVFIRRTREFIPAPADGIPGAFYETETEAAPEAERAYREMCDGLSFISYTEADIDSVEMITQNGLLHDLTVVERLTEREGSKVADFNTAVFGTGTPVMITPPAAMATVAETPAVVWNASLPSARAIRSAVPLLRIAKKTTILSSADNPHADPSALARYLDCYGIKCEVQHLQDRQADGARPRPLDAGGGQERRRRSPGHGRLRGKQDHGDAGPGASDGEGRDVLQGPAAGPGLKTGSYPAGF